MVLFLPILVALVQSFLLSLACLGHIIILAVPLAALIMAIPQPKSFMARRTAQSPHAQVIALTKTVAWWPQMHRFISSFVI